MSSTLSSLNKFSFALRQESPRHKNVCILFPYRLRLSALLRAGVDFSPWFPRLASLISLIALQLSCTHTRKTQHFLISARSVAEKFTRSRRSSKFKVISSPRSCRCQLWYNDDDEDDADEPLMIALTVRRREREWVSEQYVVVNCQSIRVDLFLRTQWNFTALLFSLLIFSFSRSAVIFSFFLRQARMWSDTQLKRRQRCARESEREEEEVWLININKVANTLLFINSFHSSSHYRTKV